MSLLNKFCGWLLAAAWLSVTAHCVFAVYFILTFTFVPRTLSKAIHEEWRGISVWSLSGLAFFKGSWGVALRRGWGKYFSVALCIAAILFLVIQRFIDGLWGFGLGSAGASGLLAVLALTLCWLNTRGGRMYFQRAGHSA